MKLRIGDLSVADKAGWLALWGDYLAFYEVQLDPAVTERTWARLMDAAASLQGRAAWDGEVMLGFALHLTHSSTWVVGEDCYLEDLFVSESARGHGVGRALIEDLQAIARAKGCHRLYWHTDQGNMRARALYDSFVLSDGHVRYRMKL